MKNKLTGDGKTKKKKKKEASRETNNAAKGVPDCTIEDLRSGHGPVSASRDGSIAAQSPPVTPLHDLEKSLLARCTPAQGLDRPFDFGKQPSLISRQSARPAADHEKGFYTERRRSPPVAFFCKISVARKGLPLIQLAVPLVP
ncbi:hypothetical protein CISG_01688 [Coccidioides immitis RMSCC 3703]|uniref:Uncharacterized protein n=1 Tax=Coccidioides immitis RMSCC 3703 TaxID=454286 RepID=A0A0J8R0I6_COCIT|nr:hypothetical protein CISG_01688 [Coccidioides immitis RMSCC 3703]